MRLLFLLLAPALSYNLPSLPPIPQRAANALLPAFLSASLVFAPPANVIPLPTGLGPQPALAKELASGSGSRVNKDADSLLRYGLPSVTKEARQLQAAVEGTKGDLASKR